VLVMGNVLGLTPDPEQEKWFRDHAQIVIRVANPLLGPDDAAVIDAAAAPFVAFLRASIAPRRAAPTARFLSSLVLAKDDDGSHLDDETIFALVIVLMLAGMETTSHVLATGIWRLASHPTQRRLFLQGEVSEANAIEELTRFDPPGKFLMRYAREDIEAAGQRIATGQ